MAIIINVQMDQRAYNKINKQLFSEVFIFYNQIITCQINICQLYNKFILNQNYIDCNLQEILNFMPLAPLIDILVLFFVIIIIYKKQ
ncbi:hypothetical protein pb186bvf_009731 [Paramecium bursaria]